MQDNKHFCIELIKPPSLLRTSGPTNGASYAVNYNVSKYFSSAQGLVN
jgi:hypothetical protein